MMRLFLHMGGWLLVLPLLVVVVAAREAATAGRDTLAAAAQLAEHGANATATVTERTRVDRWRWPDEHLVTFTFATGSVLRGDFAAHRGEAPVSAAFFESVREGGQVPVRYLPDDPTVAELEPGAVAARGWNAAGVGLVVAAISLRNGREGCVRSRAWICDFSSQLSTIAFAGGLR